MGTIVFGPINSRRFGKSLGVDLSPNIKQCNFDCLYCELGKGRGRFSSQKETISVDEIISEIELSLSKYPNIDVLTFTANGEPTLYPELDSLITRVNSEIRSKYNISTLILSNGGNIWSPGVQSVLSKFDKVKISLDCATQKCFKKMDRPIPGIEIEYIKLGLLEFSKQYRGKLYIEILFVEGINDSSDEVEQLNSFLLQIPNIFRIDIGTVERPPAYDIQPVTYEQLFQISQLFDPRLPILIVKLEEKREEKYYLSKEELLKTIKMRPLTKKDILSLFDAKTFHHFRELLSENRIAPIEIGGIEFYKIV